MDTKNHKAAWDAVRRGEHVRCSLAFCGGTDLDPDDACGDDDIEPSCSDCYYALLEMVGADEPALAEARRTSTPVGST